jgi:glycerol kinase
MDLRFKKQFREETGEDMFTWNEEGDLAYTQSYVDWLEDELNMFNHRDSVTSMNAVKRCDTCIQFCYAHCLNEKN